MLERARRIAERLSSTLREWQEVEAVSAIFSGEDLLDPYFFVSLDVYCTGPVRPPGQRGTSFGDIVAYESTPVTRKDRFLLDQVPARIEYKMTTRFDQLTARARSGESVFRDSGTYAFYRLCTAEPLFSRSGWLEARRTELDALPHAFWDQLADAQRAQLEHIYSDLGAAEMRGDELYFVVSAGRFLAALASLLFTLNREFEPGGRAVSVRLLELERLPDSLPASIESFARQHEAVSMRQRRELAELMVRSVLSL